MEIKGSHIIVAASILAVGLVLSAWLVARTGRYQLDNTLITDTWTGSLYSANRTAKLEMCGPGDWFCKPPKD